jgi:hypothetical protein
MAGLWRVEEHGESHFKSPIIAIDDLDADTTAVEAKIGQN